MLYLQNVALRKRYTFQPHASALQNAGDLNNIRARTSTCEFVFEKLYYFGFLVSKMGLCCTKYFNKESWAFLDRHLFTWGSVLQIKHNLKEVPLLQSHLGCLSLTHQYIWYNTKSGFLQMYSGHATLVFRASCCCRKSTCVYKTQNRLVEAMNL